MKRLKKDTLIYLALIIIIVFLHKIFITQCVICSGEGGLSDGSLKNDGILTYFSQASIANQVVEQTEYQSNEPFSSTSQPEQLSRNGTDYLVTDTNFNGKKGLTLPLKSHIEQINDSYSIWNSVAMELRKRLLSMYELGLDKFLSPSGAKLYFGMVYGQDVRWDAHVDHSIKTIGMQHIFSASGYNLSVVSTLFLPLLAKKASKKASGGLLILTALFYSFVVGFGPSIIRALSLFIYAIVAQFFLRRQYSPVYGMAIVFFCLLAQIQIYSTRYRFSFRSPLPWEFSSDFLW